MTKWRCINDLFGYCECEGTPPAERQADAEGRQVPMTHNSPFVIGSCPNNEKNCDNFRLLSDMVDISALPEPHLVETLTPPEPKESIKKKSKKVLKLEAEIAQQTFKME